MVLELVDHLRVGVGDVLGLVGVGVEVVQQRSIRLPVVEELPALSPEPEPERGFAADLLFSHDDIERRRGPLPE